jgi:hypothetical protein
MRELAEEAKTSHLKNEVQKKAWIRKAAVDYSIAVAYTLAYKFDIPKEKLQAILFEVGDLFDSIQKDYVSIEDMRQALSEEMGVVIK